MSRKPAHKRQKAHQRPATAAASSSDYLQSSKEGYEEHPPELVPSAAAAPAAFPVDGGSRPLDQWRSSLSHNPQTSPPGQGSPIPVCGPAPGGCCRRISCLSRASAASEAIRRRKGSLGNERFLHERISSPHNN